MKCTVGRACRLSGKKYRGRNITAGIETRPRIGRSESRIRTGKTDASPNVHPASYSRGNGESFAEINLPGRDDDHSPPRLRMYEGILLLPLYAIVVFYMGVKLGRSHCGRNAR